MAIPMDSAYRGNRMAPSMRDNIEEERKMVLEKKSNQMAVG
jgi:hypothetical protein